MDNFEHYLILIGIRSVEYAYTEKELLDNIDYFKKCFDNGLSPYKALEWLRDNETK